MEPNRDIIDEEEEGGADREGEKAACVDGALTEDARGYRRILLLAPLDEEEGDDEHAEHHEQPDDSPIVPRVCCAAPLESKQEGDDGGDKNQRAERIEAYEALHESLLDRLLPFHGVREEKTDDDKSNGTDWKVDVETPSPCLKTGVSQLQCDYGLRRAVETYHFVREDATEQRTGDGGNSVNTANEATV